jgi:hypothetical protein
MQWPRVPMAIRSDFWRLGLTGGVVWAALALYLSIVPSYVAELLHTDNLALIGATSAVPCFVSALAQVVTRRLPGERHRAQAVGLGLLAGGLVLLVVSAETHALATVVLGAVVTGAGHGSAFLHAQDELNAVAPDDRRGEVSAAFVCCIYALVGGSVVGVGVASEILSLTASVGLVGGLLAVGSVCLASWQRTQAG